MFLHSHHSVFDETEAVVYLPALQRVSQQGPKDVVSRKKKSFCYSATAERDFNRQTMFRLNSALGQDVGTEVEMLTLQKAIGFRKGLYAAKQRGEATYIVH